MSGINLTSHRAIGYLSAVNITTCRLLRNYPNRYAPTNMTIAQGIKVAWATPGLFSSVVFGPEESRAEQLISCVNGYNNPTLVAVKEAFELFGADACVSCLLSLGSGKAAIRSLGATESDTTSTLEQLAVDCEATAQEVQRRIGSLGIYYRFSVERGLEFTQPGGRINEIVSHTIAYIVEDAVSSVMDTCLQIADCPSNITLEQLCTPVLQLEGVYLMLSCSPRSGTSARLVSWITSAVGILRSPASGHASHDRHVTRAKRSRTASHDRIGPRRIWEDSMRSQVLSRTRG